MTNRQERRIARTIVRPQGSVRDCMDAEGTTTRMGEVESRMGQRSRATQGAVAEGCTS
jgi:hypothetical protein